MRDRPLAGSDQRDPKGRSLTANHPRSVERWAGEAAMVHRRGSRLEGTTAVRSVGNLTATDGILYRNFLVPIAKYAKSTSALASARGAYGRPHGRQEDVGQCDEDGLLEGMEGRRGDVL